jgi:hypothetical protein
LSKFLLYPLHPEKYGGDAHISSMIDIVCDCLNKKEYRIVRCPEDFMYPGLLDINKDEW